MQVKGPILVEQLFQIVSCNLPESMWTNLFNTPTHLTSFLRLFSDSFHIQSNLVTLLQAPKINQKHISAQVSLIRENKKNNEELKNARNLANDNKNEIIEKVTLKTEKAPSPPLENKPEKVAQLSPRSISDRLKQPKLQQKLSEAQAKSLSPEPPLSPVSPAPVSLNPQTDDRSKGVNFRLGKLNKQVSESAEDPVIPQSPQLPQTEPPRPSNKQASNYNQSLKQRINNLVLKTLQENTGRERQTLLNHQTHSDSWKAKLFQNTRVICSVRECQMVIDDIMSKAAPKNDQAWPFSTDKVVVGFDCEGINLGIKGQLTLMQIASMSGFSYVFDLISCPQMIDNGLRRLLESPDVVKVSLIRLVLLFVTSISFRLCTIVETIPLTSITSSTSPYKRYLTRKRHTPFSLIRKPADPCIKPKAWP